MSTHPESVVNPLIAACDSGFVPTEIRLLTNPTVDEQLPTVTELFETVTRAYGNSPADVERTTLEAETDFGDIVSHFREPIKAHEDTEIPVAVDVTPGRKFMSAIAFQAGMKFGAEHVYYLLLDSDEYFGQIYSTIPSPAAELFDFAELFG